MKHFPFSAIVGLETARRSLIYHAIDPRLGGTLLMGHRGCAKSTMARAFASILPANGNGEAVPFVEVPLGTTDDRLLGSVDAGGVLDEGKWRARAGLIEQAHGGVLYIDEINLLPDHLADFVLDSAATGQYRMERDGLTRAVESRYVLVGSMNPDEGDLRPQLTDRFAHGVRIQDEYSTEERIEIARRRMSFDDDAAAFQEKFAAQEEELKGKIREARKRLGTVAIGDPQRTAVAEKARALRLEGVRAEIAVLRTARAAAAWAGRNDVSNADIEEAWHLCLGHRDVRDAEPPQPPGGGQKDATRAPQKAAGATPQFPQGAHPQARMIRAVGETHHRALMEWWMKPDVRRGEIAARGHASATADEGRRISWIGSLIVSLRGGWRPGQRGWKLRHESTRRKPVAWIFIDASRSAGAREFLANVRGGLLGVLSHVRATRFHLLVLRDGGIFWKARRATAGMLESELKRIDNAAGKSFIADAVLQLRRAVVRGGVSGADRALVCTDGFVSPRAGESAAKAVAGLRESLRRLGLSGVRAAWLHPAMARGMGGWIERVCGGVRIARIEMRG